MATLDRSKLLMQEDLEKRARKKMYGGGRAMRGYGKAYMKGGKVK